MLPGQLGDVDGIRPEEEPEGDRVVDWLRSCPEDDWFVEIESESTDDL